MKRKKHREEKKGKIKKGLIDRMHSFFKNKKVVIFLIILGAVASILGIISFFQKPSNDTNNSAIGSVTITKQYGFFNININQKVSEIPNCTECPVANYYSLDLYQDFLANYSELEVLGQLEVDVNNIKFNLPNNKTLFIDKIPFNKSITVGFCDANFTFCSILPQYVYDKRDDVCMEISVNSSWGWGVGPFYPYTKERKCITLHNTFINFLGNVTKFGLLNHFQVSLMKEGKETYVYANYYKLKMLLPTGQYVYFSQFLYNQSLIFAICNIGQTDCYIFPQYRYSEDKDVCLEASLGTGWKGLTVNASEKRNYCVQEANTGKFFSDYPVCK